MAAQTADRNTPYRTAEDFEFPVAAATKIFGGALVCINASSLATKGATATGLKCVGIARDVADNSAGAAGAIRVKVRRGCFRFANSAAADLVALADIGADCYVVDDQTVAKTSASNTRSIAGKVRDVDADGVWVEI
ncbi:hypothetical protein [Thauera butanivorans]|uniref:hypothetical protein n=1 Tax=Thauera butanivorans TaxID=86174 RepID=UPI000838ADB1|nr:hypothetical protein [Thauera butanivorans]